MFIGKFTYARMEIFSDQLHEQQHIQDDLIPAIAPSGFWPVKGKEASKSQGMGLAYNATQKIINAKKSTATVDSRRTDAAPKKFCVCAPTNHAGSFKCRLHRICATHKSLSSLEVQIVQTRVSRFGRATAASIESLSNQPNLTRKRENNLE